MAVPTFLRPITHGGWDSALMRWALILVFALFGYAKWFPYEAQALAPMLSNSPLLSWMPQALGLQGASFALGGVEWAICLGLIVGIWLPWVSVLASLGSVATFLVTLTLISSTPGAWEASAGGFPAMGAVTQFLVKDVVLLAGSFVLLKSSLCRVMSAHQTPDAQPQQRAAASVV